MMMMVRVEGGDEHLHHPWHSNSPSSELSSAGVTQPNCGALEQRTFTLIVVKLEDGGYSELSCGQMEADALSHTRSDAHTYQIMVTFGDIT